MALDLTSLERAIDALQRSISVASSDDEAIRGDVLEAVRAGVIQNFEVAYEQCWKFTQRWLRRNTSAEEADFPRTRKDLFRAAARAGLISDSSAWFSYGDARNLTSHTYNQEEAAAILQVAEQFLNDARNLLNKLLILND